MYVNLNQLKIDNENENIQQLTDQYLKLQPMEIRVHKSYSD